MKVALIHEHLAQDGGAEKVLRSIAELYPAAPIYTLLYEQSQIDKYFKNRQIQTSIIQKLPGGVKHYQWYMPFMPMAVEFFDLRQFEVVISSASAFAKGAITSANTLHICYCHSPTRYIWDYTHQYINELKYNKYLKKIISLVLNYIRIWDKVAADRVDVFVANSKTVQRRIAKYYRRNSVVIYPPVQVDKFSLSSKPKDYFLAGARLTPYKRIDIAIEAFKQMPDKNLKIFGDGVDLKRLKKIAQGSPNIEFLGRVSEEEKALLYRECLAYLNPQEEDFGITTVEALASGRPVIAFRAGGALEIIKEGESGLFFSQQESGAIIKAIRNFRPDKFNPVRIKQSAERFSEKKKKKELKE
ncbi:glycosyltransferase family 4 protein, partial [Candidatus Parcubacteria bacterium]